jgi:general secretion pathway protein D
MLGGREVELVFFKDFEKVAGTRIADKVVGTAPVAAVPGPTGEINNAMVLVTADLEGLIAFEDALNLFFGNAPQVEIEIQVIEYSTTDSLNFGVSQVGTPPLPILSNRSSRQFIRGLTETFPLNPPLIGGTSITGRGGLTLGGIHDSWELNARLEMLEANSLADIISRPKMVVRNGGIASVSTSTSFPYPKAKITSSGQNIVADIEFKPVGIVMNIRPMIAGTDTVILEIFADVSVVTGFADTDPVDTPIIANRSAVTSVHVPNRMTTVIGGLKSQSKLDSESKIPILGDIPLLGYLFRSTSTQKSETTLAFHITPRIIEGPSGMALK